VTSSALLYATGLTMLGALGLVAFRWPRLMLTALILSPILDRYLLSLVVPETARGALTYFSEALLLVVGLAVLVRAIRNRRLRAGLGHPANWLLLLFAAVGALSAMVNAVPPVIAAAGLFFTLDAAALFSLARLVPFNARHATLAAGAFVGLVTAAALLALGQVLLHPNFLGLETFTGRFGEGQRVASFLVSPNMLGILLAMAVPFVVLAALHLVGRERIAAWLLAGLLSLALLYTFSRGAWLSLAVAMVVIGLAVDRRVLPAMLLLGLITFGIAVVLPRHIFYPGRDAEGFDLLAATQGRIASLGEGDLRLQFVDNALPIVGDHLLIGAGPGRYGGSVARDRGSPLYTRYTAGAVPSDQTVDNFWLHLLVESGVIGSLLLLAAILVSVGHALAAARRCIGQPRALLAACAAVGMVVTADSITEMVLEGNTTAFAAWFLLGMATSLTVRTPRGSAPPPTQ
jgi:O-antigen ligase